MPWGLPRIIDSPSKYKPHIGYPGVQGNPDVSHVEITLELPADTLIVKGAPYEPLSSLRVAQLRLHFWVTLRPHTKYQITQVPLPLRLPYDSTPGLSWGYRVTQVCQVRITLG